MSKFRDKALVYGLCAMLVSPAQFLPSIATAAVTPTGKIYQGGFIYTMTDSMAEAKNPDHKANMAEIVITNNGKIIYAGDRSGASDEQLKGKTTVNLGGRTMLPGFIDPHGHFPGFAETDLYGINLYPSPINSVDTLAELIKRVKTRADLTTGGLASPEKPIMVQGKGYDDSLLDIQRQPTAEELNNASSTLYIALTHISGHLAVINKHLANAIMSKEAMIAASNRMKEENPITSVEVVEGVYTITRKDDTKKPYNGFLLDTEGNPTGTLNEIDAMSLAKYFESPALDDKTLAARSRNINQYASATYAAAGVTTANQSIAPVNVLPALRQYIADDGMKIRLVMHPSTSDAWGGPAMRHMLGWKGATNNTDEGFGTVDRTDTNAETNGTRIIGDDLTHWSPFSQKIMTSDNFAGLSFESIDENDFANLPADRLLLGTYKILFDGSNQGYTGYLKVPGYWDLGTGSRAQKPNDPLTNTPPENSDPILNEVYKTQLWGAPGAINVPMDELKSLVNNFHKNKQGTTIHSNGSWANEKSLVAIEEAVWANQEVKDTRHTIIHAQMQERQQTQRLVGNYADVIAQEADKLLVADYENLEGAGDATTELGKNRAKLGPFMKAQNIVSSYYVDHTFYWGDRHRNIFMGPGRGQQISPLGWAVEYDNYYTSHCDTPIVSMLALRTLEAAVTRIPFEKDYALTGTKKDTTETVLFPELKGGKRVAFWDYDQRVNVLQGLRAITVNSAFSNKIENIVGSIKTGLYADFVILDENPFTVNPTTLADIRITTTIVADEVVHGVLPGEKTFASTPQAAINQQNENSVTITSVKVLSSSDLENYLALDEGSTSYGHYKFDADVTTLGGAAIVDTLATFQFDIFGNGEKISTFELQKLINTTKTLKYTHIDNNTQPANGKFWITKLDNPHNRLAADTVLVMNQQYVLYFAIADADNMNSFDQDRDIGKITDPVRLVTTGSLPTNDTTTPTTDDGGSSSGGCTVGTTPNYDMVLLLLSAFGLLVFRAVRRRD